MESPLKHTDMIQTGRSLIPGEKVGIQAVLHLSVEEVEAEVLINKYKT